MARPIFNFVIITLFFCFSFFKPKEVYAGNNPVLSIDNDTEIISAAKESEPKFKAAASVYTLSSDDIRRSGATSIPEVLRLVPGLEVTRAGSSKWSVTSRGFGRLYDNKVLVLVDGRELYSSVFTGTNWDVTDMVLEDIERIEVIRGTSVTLWGANTLNGVINIITKEAKYTQGGYASLLYGNKEKSAEFRQGGANKKENIFYRLYAKKVDREALTSIDYLRGNRFKDAGDDWSMLKSGFRIDWQKTLRDTITFQGDVNDGKENQTLFIPTTSKVGTQDSEYVNGYNLDSKWQHIINKTDNTTLHAYIDNNSRKSSLGESKRNVFNLDGEYHLKIGESNKLKLGLGYRHTVDKFEDGVVNNILVNHYMTDEMKSNLYTGFLQDTYSIIPNKLDFIFGAKYEHHYITGNHIMPSTQLRWTPNDTNTIWTSASQGIREPSAWELDWRHLDSNVGPYKIYWQSNPNFQAEKITSYEMGYRNRSISRLEFDISVFHNQYSKVRTFEPNVPKLQYEVYNKAQARSEGINSDINVNLSNNWNVVFGYSYLEMNILLDKDSRDTISLYDDSVSPRHQFKIQSRINITKDIDFDTNFYYVSPLKSVNIPDYERTDLRLAYRPFPNLELSIVGQKLFYGYTRETTRSFYSTHNATEKQFYGNIKWKF
jgi:iron complex outermembrane receptor protein